MSKAVQNLKNQIFLFGSALLTVLMMTSESVFSIVGNGNRCVLVLRVVLLGSKLFIGIRLSVCGVFHYIFLPFYSVLCKGSV